MNEKVAKAFNKGQLAGFTAHQQIKLGGVTVEKLNPYSRTHLADAWEEGYNYGISENLN